jgi:transketolase
MTGDGELQEGQIWESFQAAAHQRVGNLCVIVDHNKVQSDKLVSEILNLRDLEEKFRAFGWHTARCDGHDMRAFSDALASGADDPDRPRVVVADTLKGAGVSFMEHPGALRAGNGLYGWHAGAPDDSSFRRAYGEVVERLNGRLEKLGLARLALEEVPADEKAPPAILVVQNAQGEPVSLAAQSLHAGVTGEYVAEAYGDALRELVSRRGDLVVLDADLAADCRIRSIEDEYPGQFIQNGIAEQDMVSMAGGLARAGRLPVVNSFASFLASRANEQIYNNASENGRVIYACHYAGLIPAGPGKSHQSIRDISLLGALPNLEILQPCNAEETRMVVEYAVERAEQSCAIRLVIGPSPRRIELPDDYRLQPGRGVVLREGGDAVLVAYGPVMLHEALLASELLQSLGVGLRIVNLPWLNRFDAWWLRETLAPFSQLYVLEDHAPVGGLGDRLLRTLADAGLLGERRIAVLGVEGYPACGTPPEALRAHGLDGASLAARVLGDRQGANA